LGWDDDRIERINFRICAILFLTMIGVLIWAMPLLMTPFYLLRQWMWSD